MTSPVSARPTGQQIDPAELEAAVGTLLSPGCAPTGTVRVGPYVLEYVSPRAFAYTLRLLFGSRIYDVDQLSAPQRIIDGGGWLGLSVLRFRMLFPHAHIVVFEPDPDIYRLMCRNLERNGITNVDTVQAALAAHDGEHIFTATGSDSGSLAASSRGSSLTVTTTRLSPYLSTPVSLLKLNIEGSEADVIEEISDRLGQVDQLLIEYHGFCELPQTLHTILGRLHEAGHTYLVSHFNETNRACVPPLRLDADYRYFLLIYARRIAAEDRSARRD
ncbi:FkbM family methyltransferase [Streptomyces lasalocidi]